MLHSSAIDWQARQNLPGYGTVELNWKAMHLPFQLWPPEQVLCWPDLRCWTWAFWSREHQFSSVLSVVVLLWNLLLKIAQEPGTLTTARIFRTNVNEIQSFHPKVGLSHVVRNCCLHPSLMKTASLVTGDDLNESNSDEPAFPFTAIL